MKIGRKSRSSPQRLLGARCNYGIALTGAPQGGGVGKLNTARPYPQCQPQGLSPHRNGNVVRRIQGEFVSVREYLIGFRTGSLRLLSLLRSSSFEPKSKNETESTDKLWPWHSSLPPQISHQHMTVVYLERRRVHAPWRAAARCQCKPSQVTQFPEVVMLEA